LQAKTVKRFILLKKQRIATKQNGKIRARKMQNFAINNQYVTIHMLIYG
jgi:hypothetical protein